MNHHPNSCQNCSSLQQQYDQVLTDYQLSERECRRLRRANAALERRLIENSEKDPNAQRIREVLQYWKATWSKSNRVDIGPGSDRWEKVRTMLKRPTWTVERLKHCIDGIQYSGWHIGENPDHKMYIDITNIFRSVSKAEEFERLFLEAKRKREYMAGFHQCKACGKTFTYPAVTRQGAVSPCCEAEFKLPDGLIEETGKDTIDPKSTEWAKKQLSIE